MGLAGCQTTTLETDVERKPVTIRFGGFNIEVTTHSRTTLADACTALNYYRYTGGTQTGSKLITASDDGFGKNPSFELAVDAEWDEVNEWEF